LVLFGLLGTRKGKTLRAALTSRRMGVDLGMPAMAELPLGSLVAGNYRVIKELGRGGMGVVYEGLDEALQRRVAIKRLLQDASTTREDLDRFLREARLVAQLKHPNLAQIYNVIGDGQPLLVFEYVDGQTLDKLLSVNRTLPAGRVRRIVEETASALGAAHARDIIHRDLKPSNVMMGAEGSIKVMDFGIAHQARSAAKLTMTSASGTPPYMSPEQGMGSVSKASDLYALAVMAYELLAGVRPFEGPDFLEQKLQKRYCPITERNAAFPGALDEFFARALEPDPTKRFTDAGVFAEEFGRALEATPRREKAAA
jgi:serine/threonine protein kinase